MGDPSQDRSALPPRVAEAFLSRLLPIRDRCPILGDLAEEFTLRVQADGVKVARSWYRHQVVRSILPALGRRLHRGTMGKGEGRVRVPKIGFSWLDVKLGLRMLVKHPGLTFVAVFALAERRPERGPFELQVCLRDAEADERHGFWNDMLAPIFSGPDDPNYAIVIVKPYRFFYRVEKKVVWIVAVCHGAQLPARP